MTYPKFLVDEHETPPDPDSPLNNDDEDQPHPIEIGSPIEERNLLRYL